MKRGGKARKLVKITCFFHGVSHLYVIVWRIISKKMVYHSLPVYQHFWRDFLYVYLFGFLYVLKLGGFMECHGDDVGRGGIAM